MVWYSHLLKNFPQFAVIYTVKGFGVINKAEVDVFMELSYSQSNLKKEKNLEESGSLTSDYTTKLKSSKQYDILINAQSSPSQTSAIREP